MCSSNFQVFLLVRGKFSDQERFLDKICFWVRLLVEIGLSGAILASLGCHTASKFEFGAWERHGVIEQGRYNRVPHGDAFQLISSATGAIVDCIQTVVRHAFFLLLRQKIGVPKRLESVDTSVRVGQDNFKERISKFLVEILQVWKKFEAMDALVLVGLLSRGV